MPRVLIFAGAPEADWSSPDALLSAPAPAHSTPASAPAWRSLPLHRAALETGFSQHHSLPSDFRPPAHFSSVSPDVGSQQPETASQELLSRFCDRSLALHHDIASSQLPPPPSPSPSQRPPPATGTQSFDTTATDSFITTAADSFRDTTTATTRPPPPLAASHHLSDLEDIPPGAELLRLAPQTVTVNLIAGVISVSPARSITTRWGTELALVEVLVGDETRAGFGVTFWLPASAARGTSTTTTKTKTAPGATLPTQLRRQDVVLLQNVALHVFRGKVYGQSLRKGLTRTTVLYRRRAGDGDEGGHYRRRDLESAEKAHPQLAKTRRVWDWVLRFVGGEERPEGKGEKRGWDLPPDDTQ